MKHVVFRTVYTGLICILPFSAHAAIIINEIAWMGTHTSASDEWIELFNSGTAPVSLDGWVLSDGVSLEIPLSGTLAGGVYGVLERTDDTSAPGTAFSIYTGGLSNEGRTLTLRRANGSIEDQVAGGAGWSTVGGDNTTKETAQYTSGGWVTGAATPGSKNQGVSTNDQDEPEDEEEENNENTSGDVAENTSETTEKRGGGERVSLVIPDDELSLTMEAPDVAYVGQPVNFSVTGTGLGKHLLQSLVHTWNFGDFHQASGETVTHTFMHPGEYVVVVESTYARHTAAVRTALTVLPFDISIVRTAEGDVRVQNDAVYEIEVSGLTVTGDTSVTFPEHSFLRPHATVVIDKKKIERGVEKMVGIYDAQRTLLAAYVPGTIARAEVGTPMEAVALTQATPIASQPLARAIASPPVVQEPIAPRVPEILPVLKELPEVASGEKETASESSEHVAASHKPPVSQNPRLPYLGLVGVIALGVVGVFASGPRRTRQS